MDKAREYELYGPFKSLLMVGLLEPNPRTRLGAEGRPRVEDHPFFSGIDFEILAAQNHTCGFWAARI